MLFVSGLDFNRAPAQISPQQTWALINRRMAARLQHSECAIDLPVIPKGRQANDHEMPKMRNQRCWAPTMPKVYGGWSEQDWSKNSSRKYCWFWKVIKDPFQNQLTIINQENSISMVAIFPGCSIPDTKISVILNLLDWLLKYLLKKDTQI